MKITGNESISPTTESNYINNSDQGPTVGLWGGLTFKQHMVIEFTKALISSLDWNRDVLNANTIEVTVKKSIEITNEVIEQLNQEE